MRRTDRSAVAVACAASKADSILLGRVRNGAACGSGDAVAIVGDRIVRVGDRREVLAMRGPRTRVFEAPNGAIVPGFVDAVADDLLRIVRNGITAALDEHLTETANA